MRIAFVTQWFPPEPGHVLASAGLAAAAKRRRIRDSQLRPIGEPEPAAP